MIVIQLGPINSVVEFTDTAVHLSVVLDGHWSAIYVSAGGCYLPWLLADTPAEVSQELTD